MHIEKLIALTALKALQRKKDMFLAFMPLSKTKPTFFSKNFVAYE